MFEQENVTATIRELGLATPGQEPTADEFEVRLYDRTESVTDDD